MQILLVNAYEESSRGEQGYAFIRGLVQQVYGELQVRDNNYTERRLNELSDMVVDWEHDHLHQKAQDYCQKFDKYDLIVICGDLSVLPWDPLASQVVSLIHMAKFTRKPLIATGFGAFSAIYTLATRGVRFHVLNGPGGGSIEQLAAFPRYSTGYGTFPSAWLDQETGDLYVYRKKEMHWQPVCNVGMHFVASTGKPTSERCKQRAAFDGHIAAHPSLAPSVVTGSIQSDEDVVHITKPFFNSHLLHKLPASKSFSVKVYKDWYLNRNGSLPIQENLFILGEGKKGSHFFVKDNMLLLACRMESYTNIVHCKQLIRNHIQHILQLTLNRPNGKLESSLYEFLFGEHGVGNGTYDTAADRMQYSPALSKQIVRSSLEDGPRKVDPPVMSMFHRPPKLYDVDYFALTSKRRCSSVGRRPKITVQNPMSARRKRLENAMSELGMKDPGNLMQKIEQTVNPYELEASMPEEAKDLFAGIVMKDSSVTIRRQHVMRRISYLARNPPAEKRIGSSESQNNNNNNNNNNSATIVEEEECEGKEGSQEGYEEEMDGVEDPESVQQRGGGEEDEQRSVKHVTIRPFSCGPNADSPPITATNVLANTIQINTKGVPAITDWMKVFDQSEDRSQRSKAASPRFVHQSLTERITRGTDQPTQQQPTAPKQPHSARSHVSSSSKRSQQTPRSARHIVQTVVQSFLPVHHPDVNKATLPKANKEPEPEEDSDDEEEDNEGSVAKEKKKEIEIPDVVILPSASSAQKSNYKQLTKQLEQHIESSLYEPLFRDKYYKTPQQILLQEAQENKMKYLAGEFKTIFSPQQTSLPVRKLGFVAPCGPFPKDPGCGIPPNVPAKDWEFVRRLTTPDTWVAGAWR